MDEPSASPRAPEDVLPTSGMEIEQEVNGIRYELLVRVKGEKVLVMVRWYDDGDTGLSVRYT